MAESYKWFALAARQGDKEAVKQARRRRQRGSIAEPARPAKPCGADLDAPSRSPTPPSMSDAAGRLGAPVRQRAHQAEGTSRRPA